MENEALKGLYDLLKKQFDKNENIRQGAFESPLFKSSSDAEYLNPFAVKYAIDRGLASKIVYKDGTKVPANLLKEMNEVLSKDYTDANDPLYIDFTRDNLNVERPSDAMIKLIERRGTLLSRVKVLTANKNKTIPIEVTLANDETLVSTTRTGTQTGAERDVFAMYGYDMIVHPIERQSTLKNETIINNLHNPNFESEWIMKIDEDIVSSMEKLALNGWDDNPTDNGQGSFFRLSKGYVYHLLNRNSKFITANGLKKVVGRSGHRLTPQRVNIVADGVFPIYTSLDNNDYTPVTGSVTVSGGDITVAGSGGAGSAIQAIPLKVTPNTKYTFTYSTVASSGETGQIDILAENRSNVLNSTSVISTDATNATIDFWTGNSNFVFVKLYANVGASGDDITYSFEIEETAGEVTGNKIISAMDSAFKAIPVQYRATGLQGYEYLLSPRDAELYRETRRAMIAVANMGAGNVADVSTSTEYRDALANVAQYPPRNGIPVRIEPNLRSLGDVTTAAKGSIVLANTREDFLMAISTVTTTDFKYEPRLTDGGGGYEFTKHLSVDFDLNNAERMVIVSVDIKAEAPTLYADDRIKSTEMIGGNVDTEKTAYGTLSALTQLAIYSDTVESKLVISKTDLENYNTLEDAVANGAVLFDSGERNTNLFTFGSESLADRVLGAGTKYYVRAYVKDDRNLKSSSVVNFTTAS